MVEDSLQPITFLPSEEEKRTENSVEMTSSDVQNINPG